MNIAAFIARRVAFSDGNSFSALIIRIATAAVALSVAIMICATSLVQGFKQTISDKIFGFWGHIHVTNYDANNSLETVPIDARQPFYPYLDTVQPIYYVKTSNVLGYEWQQNDAQTKGGIRHIQMYANKAGIIKTNNQLEGIVLRGIGADFDWKFMKQYLIEGDTLAIKNWQFMPNYLKNRPAETSDNEEKPTEAIVKNNIGTSSLEHHITPAIDTAALKAQADTGISNDIIVSENTCKRLNISLNTKFTVHFVDGESQRIRKFTVIGIYRTGLAEYDKKFALVDIRQVQDLNNWLPTQISGFEIFLDDIDDLDPFGQFVYYRQTSSELFSQTIKELYPNIFSWLDLQDVNEQVILLLMLLVSIINMTTALMILILERTNMIGTLKALGGTNGDVQRIFLYYAAIIIGRGLLWGNIMGIGLCLIQKYGQIITLDEEAYYVAVAPIFLNFWTILAINIGTLFVTLLVLLIPSLLVARISPVKAIRFK